ncbi:ATP-binding protein [Radiobacillus deserti]|uniref:AAA family ATPase n=1 Tax=Radiobacillus deserti TaxID=2594883 RepID=A0A516KE80_9BACI|nr:AAA family ATPase [Radiobacillus deserti]QDP39714.1 AAA family ATPase [Radiobacillus deserti]
MKINSAYIYGFGKWEHQELDFSKHSFSMIIGENESGKSTIRQFLLFMLFGFPPRKREFYRPNTGGNVGGRLAISTEDEGEIVLERDHNRFNGELQCYLSNGERKSEEWFRTNVVGLSLDTYQSIFSFDAQELYQLHTMKAEELGEVLLGVGMTGSDQIYAIEKRLDQYLNELFKPQGRNPAINQQVERLEAISQEIARLEHEQELYVQTRDEQRQLQQTLQELIDKQEELQEKEARLTKKLEIHPQMVDYYVTLSELTRLEKAEANRFPTQGVERYQQLKDKLLPILSEIRVLKSTIESYETDITEIEKQLVSHEQLRKMEHLLQRANTIQQVKLNMDFKHNESDHLKEELRQLLQRINAGIEVSDLDEISIPFHIEDYWNQLHQEKEKLIHSQNQLSEESSALERQRKNIEVQQDRLKRELLPEQKVQELEAIRDRYDFSPGGQNNSSWSKAQNKRIRRSTQQLILGGILAFLFGIAGYFLHVELLFPIGVSIAILSIGQVIFVRNFIKNDKSESLTTGEVELYTKAKRQLESHYALIEEWRQLEAHFVQIRTTSLKLQEKEQFYEQAAQQLQQKVHQQIEAYPFLERIELSYWPRLYSYLEAALEKRKQWQQIQKELVELYNTYQTFEAELTDVVKVETVSLKNVDNAMEELSQQYRAQKQLMEQMEYLKHQVEEKTTRLSEFEERIIPYEDEIQQLFEVTGVHEEDEYLKRGALHEKWEKADQHFRQLYHALSVSLANHELEELRSVPPIEQEKIELEREQVRKTLEEQFITIKDIRQSIADLHSKLTMMEKSEHYSKYLHEFYAEKVTLQEQIKRWTTYKIAQTALQKAKQNYLDNHMPTIMEVTTALFKQLTDGKYKRVFAPMDGNSIQVENDRGQRFQVNQLSQGTSDQLYIALRLALGTVMSEQYGLPFIMDDAFVHFDEKRSGRMMDILVHLSERHQVLLFSCRAELLPSSEDVHVISLSGNLTENRSHS